MSLTTTPSDFELPYEDVEFGHGLHGWFIPAPSSHATVIFVHGWAGCREERWVAFLALARRVNEQGMNALLLDLGYVGGGRPYTGGCLESEDIRQSVKWVRRTIPGPVILWGFSAGGHATLLALSEHESLVDGAITDSAFVDAYDAFYTMYQRILHLPRFSMALVPLFFRIFTGHYPQRLTNPIGTPVLVIHGNADQSISVEHGRTLAVFSNIDYWEVQGAAHEAAFQTHRDEYLNRCFHFIEGRLP